MQDIFEVKERTELPTPLLVFDCTLADGQVERWSSHRVTVEGVSYEPRVLEQSRFEMRAAGDSAESRSTLTLSLDNLDSSLSQVEMACGWKGAKLLARFAFYDLVTDELVTAPTAVYMGIADPPVEMTESRMVLTFRSRLEFSRSLLPQVRVQTRCPWLFPRNPAERQLAVDGGEQQKYSPFYRCGYSADVEGGVGNLDGDEPFGDCDGTRRSCEQRGMFDRDARGNGTRRFGGIEFVPASTLVRAYGDKTAHVSEAAETPAKYNDFVPLVYGTAWHKPLVVFSRNDGNLLHMEVLLGTGAIESVKRVVVNDIEVPVGVAGSDMTSTGWYNICSHGNREGNFNLDFKASGGMPAGDPYGGMAFLSVVVPNRVVGGSKLPKIQVLLDGLRVPTYAGDGTLIAEMFSRNPAWIMLDVLRRTGWNISEIDVGSFARAASVCDELIEVQDLSQQTVTVPRFEVNLVLSRRRTVAEVLRGIRASSGLLLRLGQDGRLELIAEGTLEAQQPAKPSGSNSKSPLAGGWPMYEFGDGTDGTSGILRRKDGTPTLRMWSSATAETPNRYSVEFQDAFNGYQQDSLSLVDVDDALRVGYEISAPLSALGLPTCEQALRAVRFHLARSVHGNRFVELETSVRGIAIRPGDIVAITYGKEGLGRAPFRVISVQPTFDYHTVFIQAQKHDDAWYEALGTSSGASSADPRRGGTGNGVPRPLVATRFETDGEPAFEIVEEEIIGTDGGGQVLLHLSFTPPPAPTRESWRRPLVSLIPTVSDGGALEAGRLYYYAVSGIADSGDESGLSFVVAAETPSSTGGYSVTLSGLWFPNGYRGFRLYRGNSPSSLQCVGESSVLSAEVTDPGGPPTGGVPPDENYDHANFYTRMEILPPTAVEDSGANWVSSSAVSSGEGSLKGYIVRVTRGRGAGQESRITANVGQRIEVAPAWTVTPDVTSQFSIVEAGWQFAGTTTTSDIRFAVPNRRGSVIQVVGRSANFEDVECDPAASFVGRWTIGGSAGGEADGDIPPKPKFSLKTAKAQSIEVNGIKFDTLENTESIHAGTLILYYQDELTGAAAPQLNAPISGSDEIIELQGDAEFLVGDLLQVEHELLQVLEVLDARHYKVDHGKLGSTIAAHSAGVAVEPLARNIAITAFPKQFFASAGSSAFVWTVSVGTWRLAAAELYVTNAIGNSPTAALEFASTVDRGLRTVSGGQYTLQVPGQLAVRSNCVPPVVITEPKLIRYVFANTLVAPQGGQVVVRLTADGSPVADMTIPAGQTASDPWSGATLPPLTTGARLNVDVLSVGSADGTETGRDLTVTVQL